MLKRSFDFNSSRLHASSAVNANDLAVDPVTVLRGKEADDAGDIDGLTDTVVGRPCARVLVDLVVAERLASRNVLAANSVVHIGLDATGGDTVDGNLLLSSVDSHAPGECLDGTLGAGVDSVLGDTLGLASDGSHQDDTATDFHPLVGLLGDEELTTGVDVEDTVKLLRLDIGEVTEGNDARVGAADIETAEVCNNIIHELGGLRNVADVGLESIGIGTVSKSLDLLNDCLCTLDGVGVVDSDLSTALAELDSHRLSDTTAGASDDGDLALEGPASRSSRHLVYVDWVVGFERL